MHVLRERAEQRRDRRVLAAGSSGVECRPDAVTTVTVCLVSDVGESSILWHIDDGVAIASSTLTAAQPVIDRADAVLVTFEMPFGPLCDLVRAGREAGARVVVQPAPVYYDPALARTLPWDCVDVLVPNQDEARALLAGPGAAEVPAGELARAVAMETSVRTVAVTLGASGCVVHAGGVSHPYPAHETAVVDATGASDAFTATLAAHLTAGAAVPEAVDAAQRAAALAISSAGGYESMPRY